MQCSEAAILAQWVQWVQFCWRLAGWIRWQCQISDINHQPLLLLLPPPPPPPLSAVSPFYSPLLLSSPPPHACPCCRACQHNLRLSLFTFSFSLHLCITFHLSALLFLYPPFLKLTCIYGALADKQTVQALLWMASPCTSGGSVRSSVALQTVSIVLRMTHSTLQRMAVSQTVRQTNSTAQTDRIVCRAYRQTAQDRQAERPIVCDRYSQHRTEADNVPIQKRPATSGLQKPNERQMGNIHRQAAESVSPWYSVFLHYLLFLFCKVIEWKIEMINPEIKFNSKLKLHLARMLYKNTPVLFDTVTNWGCNRE